MAGASPASPAEPPAPRASLYRLSGVLVASEVALPASPASGATGPPVLEFRVTAPRGAPFPADTWDHRDHGASIGKGPGGFAVRLPGFADFWIARDASVVVGAPAGGCPPETLAQLFLDQVLPLALHAGGRFAFHASAVALGGRDLVAFLGRSGAGKSTLASSLVGMGAGADALVSDDCLAVEVAEAGVLGHPSYASTRLWPASAGAVFPDRAALPLASPRTAKLRAALPGAEGPLPLRRIYLLEGVLAAPALTRLPRRAALVALAGHLYRLDPADRALLAAELDLLEKVVSSVPVATLAYARSYTALPAVREAILADLTPAGPGVWRSPPS